MASIDFNSNANAKRPFKRPRRPHHGWKDQPAFMDACASISSTTFGARRLPELRALVNAMDHVNSRAVTGTVSDPSLPFQSGGGKTSSRHLRRRITSHQGWKRHRYPLGNFPTKDDDDDVAAAGQTRKTKRKQKALLCQSHFTWQQQVEENQSQATTTNISIDNINSNSSVHWMATHLWHTKRFHMESLFGWKVPTVHTNRGPRAAIRLVTKEHSCWISDVTWRNVPILTTPSVTTLSQLRKALSRVLSPEDAAASDPHLAIQHSLLHAVDQFPGGAIGPVTWCIQKQQQQKQSKNKLRLLLWCHPSIHEVVQEQMDQLVPASSAKHSFPLPISIIQVRGDDSTIAIQKVLSPVSSDNKNNNWNGISTLNGVSGGAIFPVQIDDISGIHNSTASNDIIHNDNTQNYPPTIAQTTTAWLVRRKPCEPSLSAMNRAMCGWDVYCSPKVASPLMVKFTTNANPICVPFGMIEEAHFQLECSPPLATTFPRDYVDTEQGREYWSPQSGSDLQKLRRLLEGGWGRLPNLKTECPEMCEVDWYKTLFTSDEDDTTMNDVADEKRPTVMVRGSFGQPFANALAGCGNAADRSDKTSKKKRRAVRPKHEPIQAMPISKEQSEAVVGMCESMAKSLSLPAVLTCHVTVVGKYTFTPGDILYRYNPNRAGTEKYISCPIGAITCGSFSPSRGVYHGLAVISGARLLGHLSAVAAASPNDPIRKAIIVGNDENSMAAGPNSIQLMLSIKRESGDVAVAMALSLA